MLQYHPVHSITGFQHLYQVIVHRLAEAPFDMLVAALSLTFAMHMPLDWPYRSVLMLRLSNEAIRGIRTAVAKSGDSTLLDMALDASCLLYIHDICDILPRIMISRLVPILKKSSFINFPASCEGVGICTGILPYSTSNFQCLAHPVYLLSSWNPMSIT
jgi:hypothetical protein